MPFKVSITNVPVEIRSWECVNGGLMSGRLPISQPWYCTEPAQAQTIHIWGYYDGGVQQSWRNIWCAPEGYHVVFDCASGTYTKLPLSEPPPPPLPDHQVRSLVLQSCSPSSISAGSYNPTPVTITYSVEHYGKGKTVPVGIYILSPNGATVASGTQFVTFYDDSSWRKYTFSHTLNFPANPSPANYSVKIELDSLVVTSQAISVGAPNTSYTNLNISSISPTRVKAGQALTVWCRFTHTGVAERVTVYCALGKVILGVFDEKAFSSTPYDLPNDYSPLTHTVQVAIVVPQLPAGMYSLYFKVMGLTQAISPTVSDCVEVYEEVTPEPPPTTKYSGQITKVYPNQIAIGQPLDIYVDFVASTTSSWEYWTGWHTTVTVQLDGYSQSDTQYHFGMDGSRTGQKLSLGTMPNKTLTGTVTLSANGQTLDTKSITVTPSPSIPSPPTEYTCPYCGKKFQSQSELDDHIAKEHKPSPVPPSQSWIVPALIAAAVIALGTRKEEKHGS